MTDQHPDPHPDRRDLDRLAAMWRERDPAPPGLVERMQVLARAEADLVATDWDHELLTLVERATELAGARGAGSALTLRFAQAEVDLLLRIVGDDGGPRIDGWVVPAAAMTVSVLEPDGRARSEAHREVRVDPHGRFELTGLAPGLVRLRLDAHDEPGRPPVLTPTFEI